jgi:hypothetical protein
MVDPLSPASSQAVSEPTPALKVTHDPVHAQVAWSAGWAVGGVVLLLAEAILRLGVRAWETVSAGLTPGGWGALLVLTLLFAYGEGYRALQRRFAPRVIARAFALTPRRGLVLILAPLFALSMIGAEPRAQTRAYLAVALIVAAAFAVSALPPPWRGIVDGAVAVALSWGVIALIVQFGRALRAGSSRTSNVSSSLP